MLQFIEVVSDPNLIQSLDVISFNIWQVVISLCNLVILFLLIRKFLFKPVQKMLKERKDAVDAQYSAAEQAKRAAMETEASWNEKIQTADEKADAIIKNATEAAGKRGDAIVAEAQDKAASIVRQAEVAADMERRKAEGEIKQEIVDLSALLAEKMLSREINESDHRQLIDSFISDIGDKHE